MSREERRNYERMMKNMERGPALPPGARARAERKASRRAQRSARASSGTFSARYWIRTVLIAVALGFLAFSVQWPNMPIAAYVGIATAVGVLGILVAIQVLGRRRAPPAA